MGSRGVIAIAIFSLAACASPSPTVRIAAAPDGQAIVGVTRMSFTAEGADLPPGDTVYEWTFGDGGTATGPVVSHVFPGEGTFVVAVTARGGRRHAESTLNVTARSLTAGWSRAGGGPAGFGFYFELEQRGPVLAGVVNSPSLCPTMALRPPFGTIRGAVLDPRTVTWTLMCGGVEQFSGTVAPDLNSIAGTYGTTALPFTYSRTP